MTFKGTLKEFQGDAKEMAIKRQAILLAHDLGLGKTVTTIAALEELIDEGTVESILVVCPASVKWQWARQIKKFSDGALVQVIEGPKTHRTFQYRKIKRGEVEYAIVNYEQVVNDWNLLRHLTFDAVVLDEATYIKSPGARRSRHVKRLKAPYRFALTGQPIENRPEELFSIMEWVDPSVLGSAEAFDRRYIKRTDFGTVKYYRNLRRLRRRMGEAMHRTTREQVKDQMPAVVPQPYYIDFDPKGQRLYNAISRDLLQTIRACGPRFSSFNIEDHYQGQGNSAGPYGEIMPRLLALRMLCDHPLLLSTSANLFDDPDTKMGSKYAAHLQKLGKLDGLKTSPKMNATTEVMRDILDADRRNKIVLFSFFKPMLDILQESMRRYDSELFTGDMSARARDAAVERFQGHKSSRILFSSDAGGIGVDLPAANYLISYDLPWSAGKFDQRNGRIIRISSEWEEVTLLSMMMRGSIEERMMDMLEMKSAVSAAWLDGKGVTKEGTFEVTLGTLADFLEAA